MSDGTTPNSVQPVLLVLLYELLHLVPNLSLCYSSFMAAQDEEPQLALVFLWELLTQHAFKVVALVKEALDVFLKPLVPAQ